METSDITIEILKNIRDDIRGVKDEVRGVKDEVHAVREELGARIDDTNARLDTLQRRQVESEIRLSTEIVTLAGVVREVRDAIRDDHGARVRVDDHETRITALEKRKG